MGETARSKAKKNDNRVKAKDRAFHNSMQRNYYRKKPNPELPKDTTLNLFQ